MKHIQAHLAVLLTLPLAMTACSSSTADGDSGPQGGDDAGVDVAAGGSSGQGHAGKGGGAGASQAGAGGASQAGSGGAQGNDPLCPDGLQCQDPGSGRKACLDNGNPPAGAQTGCHDGADCKGNQSCRYTDDAKTQSSCFENCGTCSSGLTCMDVTGDGYLGCLNAGQIPSGAETGCHEKDTGCSGNATCFFINQEHTQSVCIDNCSPCKKGTCSDGLVCDKGMCVEPPCTPGSCDNGEICYDGTCIPDIGAGPGKDTVGDCPNLPKLFCDPATQKCDELIQFDPTKGDGYTDYPENGETWDNQYRSWLRRDTVMLIQYAAAYVACKAKNWSFGNGGPVGLIDMSEKDGSIPGTSINQPGHPKGTHTNGHDIDIAYFQVGTPDNRARPICDHYEGGKDAYHCTKAPDKLDPWREALFLGAMFNHPDLRVIGCDGKAGPMIQAAMKTLCQNGWLSSKACSTNKLTYEVTDKGYGWFRFHHHHTHISFSGTSSSHALSWHSQKCLIPGCPQVDSKQMNRQRLISTPSISGGLLQLVPAVSRK